jgi:hypothetical protein
LNKIRLTGQKKAVERAKKLLFTIPGIDEEPLKIGDYDYYTTIESEESIRLKIQDLIDEHNIRAAIMVNENSVWSKKRILDNLQRIMLHGTLYNGEPPKYHQIGGVLRIPVGGKPILSKYFYEFLHLHCGSMAHFNIYGWVSQYPTVEDLKKFFKKNEYGKRVLDDVPSWHTDARNIVEAIEQQLFPLESYIYWRKPKPLGGF